jgi:hypothetical protein
MGHNHSTRRLKVAANVALLVFLGLATEPGSLKAQDESYAPPPTSSKTRPARNDAYVPPPDKQTYFPQMGAPAGEGRGGESWSPPDRGFDSPYDGSGTSGARSAPKSAVMRGALPTPVEKGDLAPVMSSDGSGLPYELWRGLDVAGVEKLISTVEIPPRSPALHELWKRLITAQSGDSSNPDFTALRLEALYRSGLAREAAEEIAKQNAGENPLLLTLEARNELASGHPDKACELVGQSAHAKGSIPARLKGQAIMMAGYCSAMRDDRAAAGLAADMAREEGVQASLGLEALDALSIKAKPKYTAVKEISLLDYRIADRVGGLPHKDVLEKGEPALLIALATDPSTPVDLGLPSTEAAARLNALSPEALASIYRVNAETAAPDDLLAGRGPQGVARRAALFKAAVTEQSPMRKTRLIRAFLDDASRQRMSMIAAKMIAPATADVRPQPEVGWFAETAVEIGLASGRYDMAREWIRLGEEPGSPANLGHWRALLDIADIKDRQRGQSFSGLEDLAATGRFPSAALYRLTTVLEALDYVVPLPLWEAANKTPQPTSGYLPETGVLSELQDASRKQEFGRTVLLVMKALGPNGAEDANLIALGDSIRALKRAGLEPDARRLGLEALLASWPRLATN